MLEHENPLGIDPETMRALGYRTVDMLVASLAEVPQGPVLRRATPEQMRERLPSWPEEPREFEAILAELEREVVPYMSRCEHPRYFAFIPACSTFPGALGDFIASALNIYVGTWMEGAGPSRLELLVLDRFKEWIGYPSAAAGILVSGGSAANMTALACAREAAGEGSRTGITYVSDQAHSSIGRAARALGIQADQLRVLPTDERYRLRVDALRGAIQMDAARGLRPVLVAASAGSTNTGAIDPLPEIAELCHEHGAWLHVDGAYGGFAALTERGKDWLRGIALADSVTLDPHKWLYQPFECGCVLVRDGARLRQAFEVVPDYLKDATAQGGEVNFSDLGLQLTRSSRALKLWVSLSYFGVDAFRRAIDRCLDLAGVAERQILDTPELELMSSAQLGIVCFRRRFAEVTEEWQQARLNAALVGRFEQDGLGLVSSTMLGGRYAVRLCVMNHTSGPEDVHDTLAWFARQPVPSLDAPSAELARSVEDRVTTMTETLTGDGAFTAAELVMLPLFAGLSEEVVGRAASWSSEVRVGAGELVTERWEGARDFYVVLEGEAEVLIDGEHIRDLEMGDFFGEVAALDWGSGFGYARTATVRTRSPLRLLRLDPAQLAILIRDSPLLGDRIRETARERMRRM